MKKILSLALSVTLLIGAHSTSFAYENLSSSEPPMETVINGITYLDGIPLIENEQTCKDLERMDTDSKVTYKLFNFLTKSNPYPDNQWSKKTNSFVYEAEDTDDIENRSSKPIRTTLTTFSETKYKISGSTKFGFKGVAEADLKGEIGEKWGKKWSIDFTVDPGWRQTLKSACKVRKTKWIYPQDNGFTTKNYYAYSYNKYGDKKWVFDEEL